jgi:uncharacterized glyoxalase superfamily protein PhnB
MPSVTTEKNASVMPKVSASDRVTRPRGIGRLAVRVILASMMMHCWLEVGDQALMGADMDVGWAANIDKPKNGFDVTLHTQDKAQAQRWYEQLSEGGKPMMPFAETFWSPGFGSLIDRFGIPWMINTQPAQA